MDWDEMARPWLEAAPGLEASSKFVISLASYVNGWTKALTKKPSPRTLEPREAHRLLASSLVMLGSLSDQ